ncbi:MAG TPA: hypothetical protein VI299_18515 [Polyangiales bacterium]
MLLSGALCAGLGCNRVPKGEADGQSFLRCAQTPPPAARTFQAGALTLTVRDRELAIAAASPVRVAAFTGPVGRGFGAEDLRQLAGEQLALWIGGIGDTEALARENVARVAALRVPTVFIAGGADRWPIVQAAFQGLADDATVVQGSGLRRLTLGAQRFVVAAGAALGRYALDDQSCGLTPEDVAAIRDEAKPDSHSYLLSWHAPARSLREGSAALDPLAGAGGLFAFPEQGVPRLGAPGIQRLDGARLRSQVGKWDVGPDGLRPRP